MQAVEAKRSAAENKVASRLRPFLRFVPAAQHEAVVDGFVHELRLRARIAKLKEYRRAGLTSLVDSEVYEVERRKRREAAAAGHAHALALAQAAAAAVSGAPAAATPAVVASGEAPNPVFVETSLACDAGSVLGVPARDAVTTGPEEVSAVSGGLDLRLHPGTAYLNRNERRVLASTHILPASYLAEKAEFLLSAGGNAVYPPEDRKRRSAATATTYIGGLG